MTVRDDTFLHSTVTKNINKIFIKAQSILFDNLGDGDRSSNKVTLFLLKSQPWSSLNGCKSGVSVVVVRPKYNV